jgi:hypothetical protein
MTAFKEIEWGECLKIIALQMVQKSVRRIYGK